MRVGGGLFWFPEGMEGKGENNNNNNNDNNNNNSNNNNNNDLLLEIFTFREELDTRTAVELY